MDVGWLDDEQGNLLWVGWSVEEGTEDDGSKTKSKRALPEPTQERERETPEDRADGPTSACTDLQADPPPRLTGFDSTPVFAPRQRPRPASASYPFGTG